MARRRKSRTREVKSLHIEKIVAEGKGLARDDEGKVIFVDYAIPQDVVDVFVYKSKKDVGIGRIEKLLEASALRIEPFCSHFGSCGGCRWQQVSYETQLSFKHNIVSEAFQRIAKVQIPEIPKVVGAKQERYYRNKLEYSFSNNRWLTAEQIQSGEQFDKHHALGFHVPNYFDKIVDIEHCYLQAEPSNAIKNALRQFAINQEYSFYDLREKKGFLRNLIVRNSSLNEWMVIVVFGAQEPEKIEEVMMFLQTNFQEITSLNYIINEKKNDSIQDQEVIHFSGSPYLMEQLDHCKFQIGPRSFFQTNTKQAEVLYRITDEFAELTGNEVVYDLFTGTGSIANYVARNAKSVVGIELVAEAIEHAKINAKLNNNENCSFFTGKVEELFSTQFIQQNGSPDVIIVDPPRAGLHPDVVRQLNHLSCPRIVYVSCNPSTQARDVSLLQEQYEVTKIQPVDLFPQTFHIENVIQLTRK